MLGLGPETSLLDRALDALECTDCGGAPPRLHADRRPGGVGAGALRGRGARRGGGGRLGRARRSSRPWRAGWATTRASARRVRGSSARPFPLVLCGGVLRHPSPLLRTVLHVAHPRRAAGLPGRRAGRGCRAASPPTVSAHGPDLARLRAPFAGCVGAAEADVAGIRLDDATKVYPNGVKALDARHARHPRRRVHGPRRPVRLRQVDAPADDRRASRR